MCIMKCRVRRYEMDGVQVVLENGLKAFLHSEEISDLKRYSVDQVEINDILCVDVNYTDNGIVLKHKSLIADESEFVQNNIGGVFKARVGATTSNGVLLDVNGRVYLYAGGWFLEKGTQVYASLSKKGRITIEAVLYDEEKILTPTYQYRFEGNDMLMQNQYAA